jgi:hypothetical protein
VDGFLFALLIALALASGGRDQQMVAQWSDALGQSTALLAAALLSAGITAAAMALIGADVAALLPGRARQMLVAFALGAAVVELAWPARPVPPREPTRSLFAVLVVLAARQIGDGARFGILAFAAWSGSPIPAALGGALGGAAAVYAGWSLGAAGLARWPLRWLRIALAAGLGIAALFIGLNARFGA